MIADEGAVCDVEDHAGSVQEAHAAAIAAGHVAPELDARQQHWFAVT
jgi:hypothetical protein